MCTTTNENETPEVTPEVEPEPRDINILLALDTYQGMTDAEIDLVMNYKIERALASQEVLVKTTAETQRMEQVIADNRASSQRALDLLESIVSREFPTVAPVEPQQFVPTSIA